MLVSTCVFSAQASEIDGYRKRSVRRFPVIGVAALWASATIDYRFGNATSGQSSARSASSSPFASCPESGSRSTANAAGSAPVRSGAAFGDGEDRGGDLPRLLVLAPSGLWQGSGAGLSAAALDLCDADVARALRGGHWHDGGDRVDRVSGPFRCGTDWKYLSGLVFAAVIGFLGMLSYAPNRMERIMAFLDPEEHRLGAGFSSGSP